jgi:hypothetical protein
MNAELKETLELARTLNQTITFSEHHVPTLPVINAAKRVREGLIGVLRKAIDELAGAWPKSDPKEIGRFIEALEHGEIPAQQRGPSRTGIVASSFSEKASAART